MYGLGVGFREALEVVEVALEAVLLMDPMLVVCTSQCIAVS